LLFYVQWQVNYSILSIKLLESIKFCNSALLFDTSDSLTNFNNEDSCSAGELKLEIEEA